MQRCCSALLFIALVFTTAQGLAQPYETSKALPPGVELDSILFQEKPVSYARAGNESGPGILFVHGTPGSWQAYGSYLADPQLQDAFFMIAVDRPGWGASKSEPAPAAVKEFDYQARAMLAVLDEFPDKRWLVVGHSLGASMAPKMAVLEPDKINGLLLVSGSLQPSLGRARWYNLAASLLVVRWLLPASLKYSNDEIMVLREELELMQTEIETSMPDIPVVVMQGMKDRLVSPKNIDYVANHWPTFVNELELIRLPDAGHFLLWENADRVREAILSFSF